MSPAAGGSQSGQPARLAWAGGLLAVGIALLLPALATAIVLAGRSLELASRPDGGAPTLAIALGALAAGLPLVLAARRRRWADVALLSLAIAGGGLRLAWVANVEAPATSTFARVWRAADDLVARGLTADRGQLEAVQRNVVPRAIPYFAPLRALGGTGREAYALPNALLTILTSLLAAALAGRWLGRRAGLLVACLSLLAPEPTLASGIPSYDIPGAAFLLAGILLFDVALAARRERRPRRAILASVGFGLIAVLLELQRAVGGGLVVPAAGLGLLFACFDSRRHGWGHLRGHLLCLAVALVTYAGALRALAVTGVAPAGPAVSAVGLAAATDAWADGSWTHMHQDYELPYAAVEVRWERLAAIKLATQLARDPGAMARLFWRKALTLFDLGSQTYFYLPPATPATPPWADPTLVTDASRAFTVVFLLALVSGAWRFLRRPWPPAAWLALLIPAAWAALFIGLTEVQPRYLFPLWYLGAIFASCDRPEVDSDPRLARRSP
jgi:hypothetical protein